MDKFYWMCSMRLRPYEQIWSMLEVLLYRLHPLMSHDCPLAIRHKKGEYIHMEIRGDCRLYLGVFDMYSVYFGFDVFLFIWVVYVRGRHYVYVFLCFFF